MKVASTNETLTIENPSKELLDFVDKLRNRKLSKLEELRSKKNFYFPSQSNIR